MYAEITKQAFSALLSEIARPCLVEELEQARKYYYSSCGVELLQIDNFLSQVSQYYVKDINA